MATKSSDLEWWKTAVIYQIYPRSFQDSNGDGIGDIKGIQSRLDYFEYLGIEALWLSPIYKSPMKDFGYDISDFTDVDPIFGTLEDLDDLIKDIHKRGMKIIMDYIPNHTSDQHPWFLASKKGGAGNPYADYYVWNKGKVLPDGTRVPPNNWLSIFGGPAWEWVEDRQAYYYHAFLKEQPDLDYRNPKVRTEMENVFKFWLERGVDGFRIDAVSTLFENHYDKDEELIPGLPPDENLSYIHKYTRHQPEIHAVVKEWRAVLNEYEKKTGKHIFMVMEVYDDTLEESMKYYHSGADMPFNFNLIQLTPECGGRSVHQKVNQWMECMPKDKWPNFVLGNHDRPRITTRKGEQYADAFNLMLLTLPGTPTTYQGEEIAMSEIKISYEDTVDPWGKNFGPKKYEKFSRDPCRIPMQWSSEKNAGFTTADKPWLPVNPDYVWKNVQAQKLAEKSSLLMYRAAVKLRRKSAFLNNKLDYCVVNEDIFSYIRTDGKDTYLITINVGQSITAVDHTKYTNATTGTVAIATPQLKDASLEAGKIISLSNVKLAPGDGLAVKVAK